MARRSYRTVVFVVHFFSFMFMTSCFRPTEDPTGNWEGEFYTQVGPQRYQITMAVSANKLAGTITSSHGRALLRDGRISGDRVSFVEIIKDNEGHDVRVQYKGKILGSEMKLTRIPGSYLISEALLRKTVNDGQPTRPLDR